MKLVKKIAKDLLTAMKYCHKIGIVHRDIKPPNILINSKLNVKLIDFAFSINERQPNKSAMKAKCGTMHYMAPELLKKTPIDLKAVDMWAMGITIIELATGSLPFKGKQLFKKAPNQKELRKKIERAKIGTSYWKSISDPLLVNLLQNILTKNPEKRLDARKALKHQWFAREKVKSRRSVDKKNN